MNAAQLACFYRRRDAFFNLSGHPWFGRYFGKLTQKDKMFCEQFIRDRSDLDHNGFCHAVLHYATDRKDLPKNYPIINELLLVVGTMESKNEKRS